MWPEGLKLVSVGFTYRRWWLWDNRIYILPSVTLVVRTSFVLLLVFDLCSWHTAPETLPCSLWITEVSCSNRVTQALCGSWMRSGHQKGQAIIRGLELSVPPILLWREKGKIGINDGSFPCDEAFIKSPKEQPRELTGSARISEPISKYTVSELRNCRTPQLVSQRIAWCRGKACTRWVPRSEVFSVTSRGDSQGRKTW